MAERTRRGAEPGLLKRLRRAVEISGLTADLSVLNPQEQTLVVTDRLAVTTVRYLTDIDPPAGQRLAEELRTMASPDEYKEFVKAGGYDVCSSLVGKASRLAAEFLVEMNDKGLLRVKLDV